MARQWSVDGVELSWALLDLKEGIAKGSFLKEDRTGKTWTVKETGMGKIVRIFNPGRSGTLTLTVAAESKLHQQLHAIALLDRQARNQVFPLTKTDNSTGEVRVYSNAFILTDVADSISTEGGTFEWEFGFESTTTAPGTGEENLVGS